MVQQDLLIKTTLELGIYKNYSYINEYSFILILVMQYRVITMLKKTFEAQKEKALMTLELLTEHPAGIGDHSTTDFYNNAEEAIRALAEADDVLETIKRHFGSNE